MKAFIVVFFYFICCLNLTYSQVADKNLQITYIANEGFLLESSTKKVLIDALFTEGYGFFSVPTKEITTNIMEGKAPFDNVDEYYLTHYHGDHCNSWLINEYLDKHKTLPFITSRPSITFIDGNCFGFIGKKKQFVEATPEVNQSILKTVNGTPVKVFGLKHLSFYKDGIDLEETMFNISFLFEMDGINIFHSGDIEKNAIQDYLATNNKWTDPVDVAFLYFNLFESGESDLDYIIETLNPKYIILMHIPPSQYDVWAEKTEAMKTKFPNIIIFKDSMDSKVLSVLDN